MYNVLVFCVDTYILFIRIELYTLYIYIKLHYANKISA